ncbi:MAG: zinc dependent phospholipase C family protein [Clostridium sp.]
MINTHKAIATNIYYGLIENKEYINKNRFIWGNLKPDGASKYKLKKHYIKESLPMIVEKIEYLSSLSEEDFRGNISREKFSSELGVVCHFLTDYFCIPHFERWEFKDSMKDHIFYEKRLAQISKIYVPIRVKGVYIDDVENFIKELQVQYSKKKSYIRDLDYAYFVCNSIVNYVVNAIKINTKLSVRKVS